ncbi:E2/UBC family protein [Nodosilinea sp. AN01ver1]|uniref:E2/UBC family protein n=1 Tax=Nodosilinea sp. AN01ver1 TaxID=3423362 RepID=UPI003D3149B5
MKPDIANAIAELKAAFPRHQVEVTPDARGGASVIVHGLSIGQQYIPSTSWVGFTLVGQYPHADVYPHFMDEGVRFANGEGWKAGLSAGKWAGRSAIQISRRSKRWNPAVDTAATKLVKVLEWLRSQ